MEIVQDHFGYHLRPANFKSRHRVPRNDPGNDHGIHSAYDPPGNRFYQVAFPAFREMPAKPETLMEVVQYHFGEHLGKADLEPCHRVPRYEPG